MPRETITTPNAPSSPLYSQAVRAGTHIYVSGTVGVDVVTGKLAGGTIQEQTRQALANCEAILNAGGAGLDDIVEIGVLLARSEDFAGFNEEYARWFPSSSPARHVARLGVDLPGILVSIRATAVTGDSAA